MRGLNYPFFSFLVDQGFVEVQTLEWVLRKKNENVEICEVVRILEELEARCGLNQVEVMKRLSKYVGIDFRERVDERVEFDEAVVSVESGEVAQGEGRVKFRCGEELWLMVVDPWSNWEGGFLGEECNVCITTTHEVKRWIDLLFSRGVKNECVKDADMKVTEGMRILSIDSGCEEEDESGGGFGKKDDNEEDDEDDDEEVASYVDYYLTKAHRIGATDVHFETMDEGMRVRYRVDGVFCDDVDCLPMRITSVVMNQLKIIGGMSVAEKRVPQEGAGVYDVEGRQCALRLACVPTIKGESVVVRCLRDGDEMMQLLDLGLDSGGQERVLNVLQCGQGLVLVVGPTGSGKTTTLYAILQQLSEMGKKIVSVEDPIEVVVPGVSQVQVDEYNGISFESALKSFLRQAPDVIMIGEIRDYETAAIAIQASCTGHLVLGTLHAEDAVSAIARMIDLGVDAQLLASVLKLVVAQRLVRVGSESAFNGRVGVFEVLGVEGDLREAIRRRAAVSQLRDMLRERGFEDLCGVGLRKVHEGVTTLNELMRCMPRWMFRNVDK